jgi:Ca-activated chloride channel family protein
MNSTSTFRWSRVAHLIGIGGCIVLPFHPLFSQATAVSIIPRTSYRSPAPPRPAVKVDVRVVLVPVTVMDPNDYPVTDLPGSSFKVYENKCRAGGAHFPQGGWACFGGVYRRQEQEHDRSDGALNSGGRTVPETGVPGDEYLLITFSSNPSLVSKSTGRPEEISGALSSLRPDGWTALNDVIYLGVQAMKRARNGRKALFVLTDGADNHSRYSESQVRGLVQESDVRVYAIGLFTRPDLLLKLAKDSGGRAFLVRNMSDLPQTVEKTQPGIAQRVCARIRASRTGNGRHLSPHSGGTGPGEAAPAPIRFLAPRIPFTPLLAACAH